MIKPLTDLINKAIEIGYFVLRSAIKQLADSMFVDTIEALLETHNVKAISLEIEITENVFLGNQDSVLQVLRRIDALMHW